MEEEKIDDIALGKLSEALPEHEKHYFSKENRRTILWIRLFIDNAVCIGCGKCVKDCVASALYLGAEKQRSEMKPFLD